MRAQHFRGNVFVANLPPEFSDEQLAEAGIEYIGDWVYDDEPTEIRTKKGPLVTLPYSVELNDIPMMLVQHHESAYFTQRCIDSFERLYREGADRSGAAARRSKLGLA